MSKLKVLISSTCYDLQTIRSELRPFIEEIGHDSVMSDYNDVTYDPSEHTHVNCIKEVKNCDMVVLIIGSRFGGTCVPSALNEVDFDYLRMKSSKTKILEGEKVFSITQVEVLKAIELSIPVYTFILDSVDHTHHIYEQNKNNPKVNIKDIDFPSIEKPESAQYIFEFINFLRGRNTNNSIATFSNVNDIKDYLKGQWSGLFQVLLTEKNSHKDNKTIGDASFNANIKLVIGAEGYLKLLANLIQNSKKEVLFTSTKMAGTNEEGIYGELQKVIIEKSQEFQKRNPERIHYGIIDSRSVETSSGSAELRSKVPDIVLRFNEELNSIKVNFFISDEEYVVLRMNKGSYKDRYSILIQNKHLAIILKKYFYALWIKSSFMRNHIQNVVENDENTLEEILDSSGYGKSSEFIKFLDFLDEIDKKHLAIPSKFIEKVMYADKYSKVGDALIFDSYKNYYLENIEGEHLTLEQINKLKQQIISNKSIDYNTFSNVFFTQYFLANYFKAKHALHLIIKNIKFDDSLDILDIGGGGGASSMAIIDFFSTEKIKIKKLDIVDSSDKQLEITKKNIAEKFTKANFINSDAYEYLKNNNNKYDLIFAGNFLCEADHQKPKESLPCLLKISLNNGGNLLVVERTESGIYDSILQSNCLNLTYYMFQNKRYKIPIDNTFFDFIIDETDKININEYIKQEYTLRFALYE